MNDLKKTLRVNVPLHQPTLALEWEHHGPNPVLTAMPTAVAVVVLRS